MDLEIQNKTEDAILETGAGPVESAPAPETEAQPEPGADAGTGPGQIAIDENGELVISDDVIDTHVPATTPTPEPKAPAAEPAPEAKPLPEVYTPEQMAKAFMENTVETGKLPEAMRDYHKAIIAEQQRRNEILSISKPQAPQMPPPPPVPQPPVQTALTTAEYAQLQEGGKRLAAKYLGVADKDFDEFNPQHANALNTAIGDIRNKAHQMRIEDYQKQVQQYQAYHTAARQFKVNELAKEWQANPDWQDIDQNFFPKWYGALDGRTKSTVDAIVQEADPTKVRQVMEVVTKAYNMAKPAAAPVKKIADTPAIMGSSTQTVSENRGKADTSKLGDMSPEEKAAWFIQNNFV